MTAIEGAKEVTLARFINALGIKQVGEETAEDLAEHYKTLDKIRQATEDDLSKIYGVGEKVAKSVVEYFSDKKIRSLWTSYWTMVSKSQIKNLKPQIKNYPDRLLY